MVRFIHPGIRVQHPITHHAVYEVVDDRGNWVNAAETFIKSERLRHTIRSSKICS
jgi:hypothetical protein